MMFLRSFLIAVSILLIGCLPPQSSMTERGFATVSYVRLTNDAGWFGSLFGGKYTQEIELFLDDGRLFTVPEYEADFVFRQGDRVLIEYVHAKVVHIRPLDELPLDSDGF